MKKKDVFRNDARLDVAGVAFSAGAVLVAVLFTFATPDASADRNKSKKSSGVDAISLAKKFKGNLPITQLTEDQAITHALNRLAYGPRPGEVEQVRQMGLEEWIDRQLDPDSIDDSALNTRLEKYPTLSMSSQQLLEQFPQPNQAAKREHVTKREFKNEEHPERSEPESRGFGTGKKNTDQARQQLANLEGPHRIIAELSMAKLDRAVYSERQLEAVMEDFWFNHFNVFANKGEDKWLLTSFVRDAIRPHTMNRFQDLLIATAKSPAMLFFLDNWLSVDPVTFGQWQREMAMRRQRYQGIFVGGFPGQPKTFPSSATRSRLLSGVAPRPKQDRGLNENYGREVMELHTVGVGARYTQQDVIEMAKCLTGWTIREPREHPSYVFKPEFHAQGKKVVMGHRFDHGGEKDGEEALAMLANDPHSASSISTALARHFVSDDPPQSLVDRMAQSYERTSGDIRSVLKTMIYSPEFWSKEAYRAKVKTPFEVVASTARALDADDSVSFALVQWIGRMGEPLFLCQPPTGYSDKSETWVNTGALLNRLNFALAFAGDHMPGAKLDLSTMLGEEASKDPRIALSRALDIFLNGHVAAGTRQALEERIDDQRAVQQVNEGLIAGLVLGSPEFERR